MIGTSIAFPKTQGYNSFNKDLSELADQERSRFSVMYRWLQRFQYWMMGRNGTDQLSLACLIFGIMLSLVAQLFFWPLIFLSYLLYFWMLFRMFSRNLPARQRENQAFLRVWNPVVRWFSFQKTRFRDRKLYRYFRCPQCGLRLRAPKGRGKIQVTCQKCHTQFVKRV